MNKNAIQRFAIWARNELIAQVSQRAYQYDITADGCGDYDADTVAGRTLTGDEKDQRQRLIDQIQSKGYSQVMEEIAYTWFNRLIALRFMEVNNYLPTHIRVFSDASGAFKPQILTDALHLDLDGLDMKKVSAMIEKNQTEDLYRYLLLTQCNALSEALPRMFETMGSYTELLLPNNILRQDSVLGRMVTDIPEEDWTDQVQIIGWLYQYYNTELKDDTFALLKKNVKITKERIPSATQLFTPDWIVRYMVENSLGRLWIEGHPDDELKAGWKYYLDEAEQEADVQAQLEAIRAEYRTLRPQDIKVIDPCMGSGHILVYAFDVLVQIYKRAGFSERDAAQSILENNLYGLDIDDRAAQLAYFAVMMKARQYDRRIFTRKIQPHVYAIIESNNIRIPAKWRLGAEQKIAEKLIAELKDAKEYGSILNLSLTSDELTALRKRLKAIDEMSREGNLMDMMESAEITDGLFPLVEVAEVMVQKYDVVATNPPYMGRRNISAKLSVYMQKYFTNSRSDLYSIFIERCILFTKEARFVAMITMHTFMFLSSYEMIRKNILHNNIISLLHLGIKAFDEIGNDVVQTASFVYRIYDIPNYISSFCRLVDCKDQKLKEVVYLEKRNIYYERVSNFLKIPGYTLAYWVSPAFINNFSEAPSLSKYITISALNKTGNNERFLRNWWEIDKNAIGEKWRYYSKGGNFRRYYGNIDTVIDWSFSAREFYKNNPTSNLLNEQYWYKEGITYSAVTSRGTGFRYLPEGCLYDMGGPAIFAHEKINVILALLNSKVASYYFSVLNPSINLQTKDIKLLPAILDDSDNIDRIAVQNIKLAKADWDRVETSADFSGYCFTDDTLTKIYERYIAECKIEATVFESNLKLINNTFAKKYGLEDEILPQLESRDNAISICSQREWIIQIISFSVGCMFGRYSLDIPGLAYAGGEWDDAKYQSFLPDKDNIIPICDDEYFDDDITGRFVNWVEVVFGKETLEENLKYIADALGGKGTPREVIRSYFLNDFYADHLKTYQKRPIYWLFDSGKKNGFKALVYMHRYQSDLLARMRTDYVHEQQERYRTQLKHIGDAIDSASTSERVKLAKQQKKLQEQALELSKYEEKIHHLADRNIKIDLDDGVVHNYELFADVLAKRK